MENTDPKWKRFEKLVVNLQKEMSPDAEITLNDKVLGRQTGIKREIDISIRKIVGQFEILIVIDCKDYAKPIDVKKVEEFLGLVNDIGANKGAIVSASGFSKAAKTRAQGAGVDVYSLVDAEDHDWRSYVALPIVCDFRGLEMVRFIIEGPSDILMMAAQINPNPLPVYDEANKSLGTALTMLRAMWNKREISEEPGVRRIRLKPEPIFAKSTDGAYKQVGITCVAEIVKRLYYGPLPLKKISGFKDEVTGNILLPRNTEIVTEFLDSMEVEKKWQRITSIDDLVIKPFAKLTAFDRYPT